MTKRSDSTVLGKYCERSEPTFHVKHLWQRIAEAGGHHLDDSQVDQLTGYREWLLEEAIPAGGLGPEETDRLDTRHIADSLLFSVPMATSETMWDLGSGAGLPGIPLAILFPETAVVLVERSGRRLDLMRRAIRMLDLGNVEVIASDIESLNESCRVVVSRASLPPEKLTPIVQRMLTSDGMAIVGGSWVEPPSVDGWETIEVGSNVLDRTVWLLIMRRQ